ncbi:MAG: FtsX-like permease family protein [Candidatus Thiodiazotropha sp.]
MNSLHFALRLLRRDWRAGELRLLATALVIAVASVTSVGFFTDRIERAMARQASEVLAADIRVESNQPIPEAFIREATRRQLPHASTLSFPSVILHREVTQLVQVKAVSNDYPLRGQMRVRDSITAEDQVAEGVPASGEAWLEERLLPLLGLALGDEIKVGKSSFRVSRIIVYEPDRSANLFRLAPRLLIPIGDIPETGLLGPASRVRHYLLLAGSPSQMSDYRVWVEDQNISGLQVEDIRSARPELRSALDQGGRFLRLAAATAILLCMVAVALSSRRFVERQSDSSALLRCLGASRRQVTRIFILRLLSLGLVASLIGVMIGLGVQTLLIQLIGDWFTTQIPTPTAWPVVSGLVTGILVLIGFSLPSIIRLGEVPPLRVFRRHLAAPPISYRLFLLVALFSLSILLLWQIGDDKMALRLISGLLAGLAILVLISRLLVYALAPLRHLTAGSWRYGLASLSRNPATTTIQLTGFGLGFTVLLLLAIVRVDLLTSWQGALPADSPNQFLINIQPDEVAAVRELLAKGDIETNGLFPMIRGRLVSIDGDPVSLEDYDNPRAQRLATRDFNISHALRPQDDNKIVAGRWWSDTELNEAWFSVEQGLAETLGIPLGAELEFEIAGIRVMGRVESLRSVEWDSFNVNFFVIGTPGLLAQRPATYITSFYMSAEKRPVLHRLIQQFPSVTALDVTAIMAQVRAIMDRGALAVESVFLFTLAAGLIVLYAGIQASHELKVQETAVLRTLGVKRSVLYLSTMLEFALLGGLAGLVSAALASAISFSLAQAVFNLPWEFNFRMWVGALLAGALCVAVAGTLASRSLLNTPPLVTMRKI